MAGFLVRGIRDSYVNGESLLLEKERTEMTRQYTFSWMIRTIFALIALVTVVGFGSLSAPAAQATPTDVGYRDFSFGSGTGTPTAEKPQSKLWFNDGIWWGALWDPGSNDTHIYRFDWAAQSWTDTGTLIEPRHNSKPDILWDGSHLYTATAPSSTSTADQKGYVRRYSYDATTKKYTLDSGFPAAVSNGTMEAIVLDKDSTGQLWVTYTQGNKVYVNRSLSTESSWGTSFVPSVKGTSVDPDDISAVVAFDRQTAAPQIGVMWSNQIDDAMYWATHKDEDPDDVWQASRTAVQGPSSADDHINLTSVQADSSGRVFAAVKTSFNDLSNANPNDPLILLLVLGQDILEPGDNWESYVFGRVADDHTRPIVLIDEQNRNLYMFATAPVSPGGTIYYKKTPLDNISFEDQIGLGTPFIKSSTDTTINNATSTKQTVNSKSGLLVEASDNTTKYYLHNTISLTGQTDTTPPETTIDTGPTGTVNTSSASFTFSSNEAGSSFACSLDGAAFTGCSSPTSYSALSDGSQTFQVRAKDAAGNVDATPASRTWTVDTTPVDTTPPQTTIDSGPTGTVNTSSASFGFSSSEAGSTFECSLDGAAFTSCSSPQNYSALSDGSHTFEVRATDAAGNVDTTPASRTWSVDTTAPTVGGVVPTDGAAGVSLSANVEATFSEAIDASTINGSTFTLGKQGSTRPVAAAVSYDSAAKKAVLNPSADLDANATYTATVKGGTGGVKDLAGNALAADKTWSFTSQAAVLSAPSNLSAARSGSPSKQRIDLSWTDNSNSEAKFVIQRSTTSSFTSNLMEFQTPANTTSYRDDASLQSKTTYYYRVFAVDSTGTSSAPSN